MNSEERTLLRHRLLKEIYEHHFSTAGKVKVVLAEETKDAEKFLAYKYLSEHGYIETVPPGRREEQGEIIKYRITIHGIDYVESNRLVD